MDGPSRGEDRGPGISRRVLLHRAGAGLALTTLPGVLAACGGSRMPAQQTAAAAPPSGARNRGGDLVFGVDTLTGNYDPGLFASFADWMGIDLVARGLTQADFSTGEIRPGLAESWETGLGGRRYVFTLRENVTFHDGEGLTAADFVRSWRRLFDPKDPTAAPGTFSALFLGAPNTKANFKALDARRFQVDLERPDVAFPAKCGVQAGIVLSTKAIEAKGKKIGQSPVGTGPFRFVSTTADQSSRFERFEAYSGGSPYLDSVVLQVIPEATALAGSLQSNAVQATVFLPPANVASVGAGQTVTEPKPYSVQLAFLNVEAPALKDLRVRQAINYALDRAAIVRAGFSGRAVEPGYVVPSPDLGYDESLKKYSTLDVERARRLVREAGAEGRRIRVVASNGRWWPAVGQIVEANLKAIGLAPRMEYLDGSAFGAKENDPKAHDVALDTYAAIMPDADDAAYSLFKSDQFYAQGITVHAKSDVAKELDRLVDLGREQTDRARRKQVYVDMQTLAAERLMAHAVLAYAPATVVASPRVVGLDVDSLGTYRFRPEEISLAA